ncbi:hypothetical protein FRC12_010011 [Ceratobasidium sp. 428]|nr:hypothetical protein FRC12_010011 [Ceratobasidium sp. 428]
MRSCKGFFTTLVPLLWEALNGCEPVFSLIEGAQVVISKEYETVMIYLPATISPAALTRLRFYAVHVKRLELCGNPAHTYMISRWDALFDTTWSSPLLPKLTALTLANPTWCAMKHLPQLPLLLMFISPSLLEYRITWELKHYVAVVSNPRCKAILYTLQHRCPKLHTLVLFADPSPDCHEEEHRLIPIEYDVSDFDAGATLKLLSISLSMVNSLKSASLISKVTRLNINYKGSNGSFEAFEAPGLVWPNLYHLSVYSVRKVENLFSLWSIPSLVGNLTGAQFHFRDQHYPSNSLDDSLDTLFSMLVKGSPKLKSLWLMRRGRHGAFVNPALWTKALGWLELREVKINSYKSERPSSLDVQRHLEGRSFSSVERLEVGRHRVELLDLQFYAKSLPNLKYLRIMLKVHVENLAYEEQTLGTSSQNCELYVPDAEFQGEPFDPAWETSSNLLLIIWPNLTLSLGSKISGKHAGWIKILNSFQSKRRRDVRNQPTSSDS